MTQENHEEKQRSNKGIIIAGIIVSIVAIFSIISFLDPVLIIGVIWDNDIEQQLLSENNRMLDHKPDISVSLNGEGQEIRQAKLRITYIDVDDTEIRINRAIEVFENMFSDPDKTYEIIEVDGNKAVQFIWKPEIKN